MQRLAGVTVGDILYKARLAHRPYMHFETYQVIKLTPKGMWVAASKEDYGVYLGNRPRWFSFGTRHLYRTKVEALRALLPVKRAFVRFSEARLERASKELEYVHLALEDVAVVAEIDLEGRVRFSYHGEAVWSTLDDHPGLEPTLGAELPVVVFSGALYSRFVRIRSNACVPNESVVWSNG